MAAAQRQPRRRSARLAFDEDDDAPPAKRGKVSNPIEEHAGAVTAQKSRPRVKKTLYDEDESGFKFTRAKSKISKQPSRTESTASSNEGSGALCRSPSAQPARSVGDTTLNEAASQGARKPDQQRRSQRLSNETVKENLASTPLYFKSKRTARSRTVALEKGPSPSGSVTGDSKHQEAPSRDAQTTKIALPFADTPVIQRNKDMRAKGKTQQRRSSSGLRGRRASSLIDSGQSNGRPPMILRPGVVAAAAQRSRAQTPSPRVNRGVQTPWRQPPIHRSNVLSHAKEPLILEFAACAAPEVSAMDDNQDADLLGALAIPHIDVDTRDFYKHIEQSLMEPQRMKHLLVWCGTRAMPKKSPRDRTDPNEGLAIDSARQIQEELLRDFVGKPELSDWFSRVEVAPTAIIKKPNPRNLQNAARLLQLEAEIASLQSEKTEWEALLKTSKASVMHGCNTIAAEATLDAAHNVIANAANVRIRTREYVHTLVKRIEPSVDILAEGAHRISQYRLSADRVAHRVFQHTADVLEAKDRQGISALGLVDMSPRDVLGTLGKILRQQVGQG